MALRKAVLVQEFGTTAIPNSIWDKPGPLTRAEYDRVELHPMIIEQILRRSPELHSLPMASSHHELGATTAPSGKWFACSTMPSWTVLILVHLRLRLSESWCDG